MMKSRQTSNIKNRFFIIVGILILATLLWKFFPTPIAMLSEVVFKPLLQVESGLYNSLHNSEQPESRQLREQDELEYLREENKSLREQVGDNGQELITTGVIGRPTALPYDVLILDKGESDGIIENAPVYADSDHVIGFVAKVHQNSSVVTLVTTPGFVSTVFVYGPNIYTTGQGLGSGVMRIHVPQGISLEPGNVVVIPSLSSAIYGSVTVVDSVPSRPEQYGYVTTDIPISSLHYVSVGTTPVSSMDFEAAKEVVENVRRDFLQVPVPDEVLIEVDEDSATTTEETATEVPEDGGESTATSSNSDEGA